MFLCRQTILQQPSRKLTAPSLFQKHNNKDAIQYLEKKLNRRLTVTSNKQHV